MSLLAGLRAARIPPLRVRAHRRLWSLAYGPCPHLIEDRALFVAELDSARPSLDPDLAERLAALGASTLGA